MRCPVWFGRCRFGGSRAADCPYHPCSAVVAKCERESQWRRQMFELRKKEKEAKMAECPECGNETFQEIKATAYLERCMSLSCDWFDVSYNHDSKPLLRKQFEDENNCQIWDVQSMVRLDDRWKRAREIVTRDEVQRNNGHWVVNSQSRAGLHFEVRLNGILGADKHCQCEDYTKRAPWGWCKHRLAAWICSQLTEAQLKNIRKEVQHARS